MEKDEKILLICAAVALVAVLLWSYKPPLQREQQRTQPADNAIPKSAYLVYNQPYMFSPPVANILPQTASGFLGQKIDDTDTGADYSGECGCG